MILTIDNLAYRYKVLPSQIIADATTFDLYVIDVSSRWIKYQHEQADLESKGQVNKLAPRAPKLTQEQMKSMLAKVKERT